MPTQVLETVKFENSEMHINITYLNGDTHLSVISNDFDGERLHAELTIHHPADDDSLNVVILGIAKCSNLQRSTIPFQRQGSKNRRSPLYFQ